MATAMNDQTQQPAVPLSRQIQTIADVESMDDDALERMQAMHEIEIVRLENYIATDKNAGQGCRSALSVLRLHERWICRELKRRDDADRAAAAEAQREREEANRQAREIARQKMLESQQRAVEARLARMREANNEDRRSMHIFKALVRNELGEEAYLRIWTEVEQRLQTEQEHAT